MQKLGTARAAHPALRRGTRTTLFVDDDAWVYQMTEGGDTVYVLLNRGDTARSLGAVPAGAHTDELTGETLNGTTVMVPARSARVLK
jgi:hypothetical protein